MPNLNANIGGNINSATSKKKWFQRPIIFCAAFVSLLVVLVLLLTSWYDRRQQPHSHQGMRFLPAKAHYLNKHGFRIIGDESGVTDVSLTDPTLSASANLDDGDLACFAEWTSLRRVHISGPPFTPKVLHNLRSCKSLRSLVLVFSQYDLDSQALEPLGDLHDLAVLFISAKSISPDAVKKIGDMGGLTDLVLEFNPIIDDDLIHLHDLHNLVRLNLGGTKVTGKGLQHLTHLKRLRTLYLGGTSVSKSDVQQLHNALPQLHIIGDEWEVGPESEDRKTEHH